MATTSASRGARAIRRARATRNQPWRKHKQPPRRRVQRKPQHPRHRRTDQRRPTPGRRRHRWRWKPTDPRPRASQPAKERHHAREDHVQARRKQYSSQRRPRWTWAARHNNRPPPRRRRQQHTIQSQHRDRRPAVPTMQGGIGVHSALGEEGAVEGWQEGRPTGRAHTPTRTRERREARRGQPPPANKRPVAHQGHGRWQSDQHTHAIELPA